MNINAQPQNFPKPGYLAEISDRNPFLAQRTYTLGVISYETVIQSVIVILRDHRSKLFETIIL